MAVYGGLPPVKISRIVTGHSFGQAAVTHMTPTDSSYDREQTTITNAHRHRTGHPTATSAAAIALLDDGNTVPFISRYRKEATGTLDEEQMRQIERVD